MNATQYRQGSRCSEAQTATADISLPIAVKRIKTTDSSKELLVPPEESPIVVIERKVELLRRLARLREDYQALERLRSHIEQDMNNIEDQLSSKKK